MRQALNSIFAALLLMQLSACNSQPPALETRDTIVAFGGFVQVTLVNIPEQSKQAILKRINDEINYMQFAFHSWKTGPIGRTNELLAAAGKFTANPSLIPILLKSQRLAKQSHGLFNPAIGKLVALWGFQDDIPPDGPPPAAADIAALVKQQPSMSDIHIDGIRVDNSNPAVRIDLNGIAKGYALDMVIKSLQAEGVRDALIDADGDLRVLGQHAAKPWHIGIRDPRGQGIIASLDARDGDAVFTSGDYTHYFEYQGKRYNHILDPRSGYPAGQTRSVTVVCKEGALADAAATALFVAGPNQWPQIAADMGVSQVMLIDQTGTVYLTPAMRARLKLEKPVKSVKVVALP